MSYWYYRKLITYLNPFLNHTVITRSFTKSKDVFSPEKSCQDMHTASRESTNEFLGVSGWKAYLPDVISVSDTLGHLSNSKYLFKIWD